MNDIQLSLFSPRWRSATEEVPPQKPKTLEKYEDPFLTANRDILGKAGEDRITFDETSWDNVARGAVGADVETFRNLFLICFKRFADGKRAAFELSERSRLDIPSVRSIISNNTIVTFNGDAYDIPMIDLALSGAGNERLMEESRQIIHHGERPERQRGKNIANHIDLMGPNPSVRQGLKMLHARLHGRYIVDLPFDPEEWLTRWQMNVATLYCFNDIDATEGLYKALREPLELRVALGRRYGLHLRSKSDAQVGEAIVRKQVETSLGRRISPVSSGTNGFRYVRPDFLRFQGGYLDNLTDEICGLEFHTNAGGHVVSPTFLENLQIKIGAGTYRMGIGGLHSTENHRALLSDSENILIDVDVASQYPNIIMRLGMWPTATGSAFRSIYGDLIKDRLAAKAAGDKIRADGGRIALNGVYGKLGSVYSVLYAPHLLIATTLTGQLSILMLIERAEEAGIRVVSANTDGLVFYCKRSLEKVLEETLTGWEEETGFQLERTRYAALYNSSVNTYVAVREDGKVKRKGWIADPWREGNARGQMSKNPQMTICSEAVERFLRDGSPVEETVRRCDDPRSFVTVIRVTGGAMWRGAPLGRVVRYYWAKGGEQITTLDGKRRIPKTEGARPMQDIGVPLPADIDYVRYCEEACRIAYDLGIREII